MDNPSATGKLAALLSTRRENSGDSKLHLAAIEKIAPFKVAIKNPSIKDAMIRAVGDLKKQLPHLKPGDREATAAIADDLSSVFGVALLAAAGTGFAERGVEMNKQPANNDYYSLAIKETLCSKAKNFVENLVREPDQTWEGVVDNLTLKRITSFMVLEIERIESQADKGFALLMGSAMEGLPLLSRVAKGKPNDRDPSEWEMITRNVWNKRRDEEIHQQLGISREQRCGSSM